MVEGFYIAVVQELRRLGFRRIADPKGSHETWGDEGGAVPIVPRNLDSRHTADAIPKDAGSKARP